MPSITIDGKHLDVRAGTTILGAAKRAGIRIPTLCFLRNTNVIGSCRMCSVEVEGESALVTACNTPVRDGMVVTTDSKRVVDHRRVALELILADHGLDSTNFCFSCDRNGACELQSLCHELGVTKPTFRAPREREPFIDSNPFLRYDPNLCIRCQRCVGACNNRAHNHILQTGRRGTRVTILAPFGADWQTNTCESCGCCAHACPTGALTEKRRSAYRSWEVEKVRTTCPHCAVGCQLNLVVKDGRIVDAEAVDGPSNKGMLCVKGRSASFDFVDSPDRIRTPLIKNHATGEFEEASWDEALDLVAHRFSEIRNEHGGESIALFACSRSTNEDVYLFQKMARAAFKTNNVDSCARV